MTGNPAPETTEPQGRPDSLEAAKALLAELRGRAARRPGRRTHEGSGAGPPPARRGAAGKPRRKAAHEARPAGGPHRPAASAEEAHWPGSPLPGQLFDLRVNGGQQRV